MQQLNRSMMERYEITDRRPEKLRALIFGADALMLGGVARLLDKAGVGALCLSSKAEYLAAQDGMFTLLIRGEALDGKRIREEMVVQSILQAAHPEDTQALRQAAGNIEIIFCHAGVATELALALLVSQLRLEQGLAAPCILQLAEQPIAEPLELGQPALLETLCGSLDESDLSIARREMNYRDDFIAWAEPFIRLSVGGEVPDCIAPICSGLDYDDVCQRKQRVFDAAVFLCTAAGYLAGKKSFADVLKNEDMRSWIGRSFFEEILPTLPYEREAIAPEVISAFERLENPMNAMPLLELGRSLLGSLVRSILPSIRAYAQESFEAPPGLSLALAAAIMLYAGAREQDGAYFVARGEESSRLYDEPAILEAFSRLSHDMPAETLAYAALADRAIWGMDLREIDGLEMRVCYDIAAIQRVGFSEVLRQKLKESKD